MASVLLHPAPSKMRGGAIKPDKFRKVKAAGPHVTVTVDPALGPQGAALAQAVADQVEAAFDQVSGWFSTDYGLTATCAITKFSDASDGTGGAQHNTCADTVLLCDADFSDPTRTLALFVAELTEVFEAAQNVGWDCGNTNGEALSRFQAESYAPGALDDYSSASSWLDTPDRPDWIHQQEGSDTDYPSIGCGVLFLYWLQSRGHDVTAITAAGGPLLGDTWYRLGEQGNPYDAFRAACDAAWPVGTPSGVTTDNPWGTTPPPPPPPPAGGLAVTFSADVPAGPYTLTPATASTSSPATTSTSSPATTSTSSPPAAVPPWLSLLLQILGAIIGAVGGGTPTPPAGTSAADQARHRARLDALAEAGEQLHQLAALAGGPPAVGLVQAPPRALAPPPKPRKG